LTLKETGINKFNKRLGVYLTNTLEEGIKTNNDLFSFGLAEAISDESKAANEIKNDRPIMVVVGNPPYSGESNNKGLFEKEIETYKQEPFGGKLKERNPKWINDDYVKFIRFAESLIEKNGEGIVAMITNHGYIDNPTFRGMRWHLVNTFNKIYILDLHGNAKKKETALNGGKDENVFDIQQGVAIIIAIKKNKTSKLAEVFKFHLRGKREEKFQNLNKSSLQSIKWEKIDLTTPSYFFFNRDTKIQKEYEKGLKVNELFPKNTVGIVTSRDNFVIDNSKEVIKYRVESFIQGYDDSTVKETSKFKVLKAKQIPFDEESIKQITYRPFDNRYIYYQDYFIERSRKEVMKNFLSNNNIGLITVKRVPGKQKAPYIFITNKIIVNGTIRLVLN